MKKLSTWFVLLVAIVAPLMMGYVSPSKYVLTDTTQTISGTKTFSGPATFSSTVAMSNTLTTTSNIWLNSATPNLRVGPLTGGTYSGNAHMAASDRYQYWVVNSASTAKSQLLGDSSNGAIIWDIPGGLTIRDTVNGGGNNAATLSAAGVLSIRSTLSVSNTAAVIRSGTGTPEAVVTAPVGSMFLRTDGGAGTTLYIKESGAGNTGWVGK